MIWQVLFYAFKILIDKHGLPPTTPIPWELRFYSFGRSPGGISQREYYVRAPVGTASMPATQTLKLL